MSVTLDRIVLPRFRAEDISWRRSGEWLEVSIEMVNASREPTEEADLVLETAAFGAFVPFVPAARITVASFDAFERRRVTVAIPVPGFDKKPLQALLAGDPAVDEARILRFYQALRKNQWAGNLNVYFDRAPEEGIELHRALELNVEAGKQIVFMFWILGDQGECTLQAFPSPGWEAEAVVVVPLCAGLFVHPPSEVGKRGGIEVRVTRTSDGQTVRVTFGMETVATRGESVGCIRV